MKINEQAKAWRLRRKLTHEQLAELSGYSVSMIWKYEQDQQRPGLEFPEWAWQRYRMICAGIDAQLRTGRTFQW